MKRWQEVPYDAMCRTSPVINDGVRMWDMYRIDVYY